MIHALKTFFTKIFHERPTARHVIIANLCFNCMAPRCNICSQDVDEKQVESHVDSTQHKENKAKLSKKIESGSDLSVVKVWQSSLGS